MPDYTDEKSILALGEIDPELKAFLEKANLPTPDYDDLAAFKAMAADRNAEALKVLGDSPPEIKSTELQYPTRDGSKLRAKLYQPTSPPKAGSPLIVMYHGGGFCIGAPEGEEQTCRNFVQAFGAVCVSASYRLAPEYKFPYAVKDSWDALKWAAENAKSWGADPSVGFVVGGTSAGGNISAVLAHVARDEGLSPPLTGQYLIIPALVPENKVPEKYKKYSLSYEQNKNAPVLPIAAIDMFMKGYEPDDDDAIWYAPFNHPKGHKDLPTALFQVDGMDPLRDEALIYERVLREEYSLKTKLYVYPGLPHGHWGFFPFLKASATFRKEQVEGMGWLLGREPDFSKVVVSAVVANV
ncbi:Alpha/Beta hydrolase protein [Exophiala viscosa]|uniref:Alpha/Beta hydrolase protein n=1 Tax=Exophiala viscosa TaxID=2486360 RepID=A0AAN6DRJ9_9EURO|nr:Alpha/Beta hydrolase protein [Exophiala viscosa]